ncbi:MAG TPA: SgcJ/EcaC family oxidoreductase [Terriglobales bacterium]
MTNDEQAIRDLVATWMRATLAGDLSEVLRLMADDVVFLTPGRQPFGRREFAAGFEGMQSQVRIDGKNEIQEARVSGDMAYCWSKLTINVTSLVGGEARQRTGYALSVLRKKPDGNWVIARDANLVS